MIDYLKSRLLFKPPSSVLQRVNSPLFIFGILFDPVIRTGVVVRYVAKLGNLHLTIMGGELIIQNSLTKYYHGNNYTNLTYTQLQQTICNIENILGFSIRNAKVMGFEYGGVILDNNIPWTSSRLGHYKGKPPLPMQANGAIYGTFYTNSTHNLKIYDKSSEIERREGLNLEKKYLRVEKVYSRGHINSLRCLKSNPIVTLDDLVRWKTLEILSQDLVNSLSKIEIKPIPKDIESMTSMNLRRWCYIQDPYLRKVMQKNHPKAFKIDRKAINQMIEEYRENGHFAMIEEVKNMLAFCLEN